MSKDYLKQMMHEAMVSLFPAEYLAAAIDKIVDDVEWELSQAYGDSENWDMCCVKTAIARVLCADIGMEI